MTRFSVSENFIFHNVKIKEYPNGDCSITVASRPVFKEKGWESSTDKPKKPKLKEVGNPSRDDSIRRAKTSVSDIVRMNDFEYFVTLTLSAEKIDRTNPKEISRKVKIILSNLVERSDLNYILIPEYHKDGKAIHFHGFMSGNLETVDSGTVKAPFHKKPIKIETAKRKGISLDDCKTVYNLPQWSLGFSSAIPLNQEDRDRTALESYVIKYITKDFEKIFGKYYLSGGKELRRNPPVYLDNTDFKAFEGDDGQEHYCAFTDTSFKYSDTRTRRLRAQSSEVAEL